jgi:RimJ/RimL family protein N-acetyltransferase
MPSTPRWSVEWVRPAETLRVVEPSPADVVTLAGQLSAYYNDAYNRAMLAHTQEMSVADVIQHYRSLRAEDGRPLLLFLGERLVGDADLRGIGDRRAELAIMIGDRALQGRGLGTAFGIMSHALAFRLLDLHHTCVSILPENIASRRLFEKLGYETDNSPDARAITDESTDVTMSLPRERFHRRFAADIAALRFVSDGPVSRDRDPSVDSPGSGGS